jgi:hypothetical protein
VKTSAHTILLGAASGLAGCGLGMFLLRTLGGEPISSKYYVLYLATGVIGIAAWFVLFLLVRRDPKDS